MRSNALHIISLLLLSIGSITTAWAQESHPTPEEEKNGITVGGNTYKPLSKIKIAGNVYGGGDQAAVQGNTNVTINAGEFGGEIFGGGNGALNDDGTVKASADVGTHNDDGTLKEGTGDTHVTINGGEIVYYIGSGSDNNHNIYGGGNLACNVAGSTYVNMNTGILTAWTFVSSDVGTEEWQNWYNDFKSDQKTPKGAVFGAGFGAHTDVADSTNVYVNIGTALTEELDKLGLETAYAFLQRESPHPDLSKSFVTSVLGGGYNGTVGAYSVEDKGINANKDEYLARTNVTISGQPYLYNVFGGGLGSKEAADTDGNKWGSRVGAVLGGTKVDIKGGFIYGSVFGGGAGINGEIDITTPYKGKMPYVNAAQVFRETDVTINGIGTVIGGNVFGGGDIANTGWYTEAARPIEPSHIEQNNWSEGKLDFTTSVKLLGGNILGKVFAGANGRLKKDISQARLIGAVIGSTNLVLGEDSSDGLSSNSTHGTNVWNSIYGGGNAGCVYSCEEIAKANGRGSLSRSMVNNVIDGSTNVEILGGMVAMDIFAGGFGNVDNNGTPADKSDDIITSADISGNTYIHVKKTELEWHEYWDETKGEFLEQNSSLDIIKDANDNPILDAEGKQQTYRTSASDINHNLYGGGNVASTVKGDSHVYLTGAPVAPEGFSETEHYRNLVANVARPHLSVFGGGFGLNAVIQGNAYSDINLESGTGMHSIIGGGMNGTVGGLCMVHVGSNPNSTIHYIYGGGYYAPCGGTKLDITSGNIMENVFGGSVMGNVAENNDDLANVVIDTTIGLQSPGEDRHSRIDMIGEQVDAEGHPVVIRSYTYEDERNQITIGGNVYGANDVSGTVNGVAKLTIYGGTFNGEVYGAGNGNHIGYYVPAQLRYDLGEHDNNYYYVDHTTENGPKGNTYVSRPQTLGGVELTLEGNTADERVRVLGQVFGGGNSCTIGKWDKAMIAEEVKYNGDPHLTRDDPDYFLGGGKIDITLGSHVSIGRTRSMLNEASDGSKYIDNDENVSGLFMGCSGKDLATQSGAKTDNYYHHFFSPYAKQYLPGFIVYDENGVSQDREEQLKPFQAYLNNILVWTDDINLKFKENAEDIWLANFVGGGFRGSMRAMTENGIFDYRLPVGVTVNHAIIGGAYNSHVKYKLFDTNDDGNFVDLDGDDAWDYATSVPTDWVLNVDYLGELKEDPDNPEKTTAILRYNYNGGMLSENSTGVNASEPGNHIHKVHADPRANENEYATAYFESKAEGQPDREDDATRAKLFTANRDKTLLYMQLNCALEPEIFEADSNHATRYANGGNVYGGCFMSGFVEGDSWVDYSCWLSPKCTDATFFGKQNNLEVYKEVADLDRNNAMSVFGAGFGTDTHSMGDVYLRIKNLDSHALGDKDPTGKFPYIYNAFGGSNMGVVDGNVNVYYDTGVQGTLLGSLYGGSYQGNIGGNTFVELASGFLFNVYGGSRQANIGGAAHVWAYDGLYRGAPDANHLIVCNLYGGNDIAGTISGTMPVEFARDKWNSYAKRPEVTLANDEKFNTYVEISTDNEASRGFPLIGSAYAGGNGLNWTEQDGKKPEVRKALIEIGGGSTLNAFGGGNMATVTEKTCIFANADGNNYANVEFTAYQKYIMQNVFFNDMKKGYKWDDTRLIMDPFHVMYLFGGNNLATMDIQPTWNLAKGRLENVYSGGNMGDMTYYNPTGQPSTKDGTAGSISGVENNADGSNSNYNPRGLCITIEQPDIFIQSLFGGCRMSDVTPTPKDGYAWPTENADDYYGATVNITDGYINNIYGGNDISGNVAHGTNVNISGAVSGNVYGSGNGFYLYKFDPEVAKVTEEMDDEYGIYYRVPEMATDGVTPLDKRGISGSDTHKILTINEVRPSVEKAFLNIGGVESYTDPKTGVTGKRVAYVKGNVFCGGNASTVTGNGADGFTKFKIGSYVTLNGVFMGSDGLSFTEQEHIAKFAKLNAITDMGAETSFNSGYELDKQHNPNLLNTYMMAVDMQAQPRDFNLNLPLKEAHIGTYCGGGNRGSMLVDKTVELPFHHDIIIYDKIVGACLNANVQYNQNGKIITSYGGYTRALANNGTNGNTKMRLNIASQFVPLVMDVPADKNPETKNAHGEDFVTAAAHDFLYDNRTEGVKYTYEEFNDLFETHYTTQEEFLAGEGEDHQWKEAPGIYAPSCNIYGGCYQSGEVEGDIELNLYSNMLRYVNKEDLDKSLAQNIACFNVYGAGFGQNSHVWGNVKINMDRSLDESTMGAIGGTTLSTEMMKRLGNSGADINDQSVWNISNLPYVAGSHLFDSSYPSFNNIVGGGRNGKLIGNSTIEVRNGLVYSDVAGGCYASDMYGSTQVIIGYPKYYECNASGEYVVQRGDTWNTDKKDVYGQDVIKQSVKYLKGDLVPENVYQQIVAANSGNASKFDEVEVTPTTHHSSDGTTWNDIHIKIGKGVYGGGYSLANSTAASAGSITTHKLSDAITTDLHPHNFNTRGYDDVASTVGYGGNSSIMLGDQDGGERDHIRISTLKVTELPKPYTATTKIGKYILEGDKYTHQGDGTPDPNLQYYELSGNGGMYGDGHLTFCEGFRVADVTRYGWAEGTAKHPILMNTFQRMDLLSINDCCLMLQGAQDFATDQIDATMYSITRINELRMNSSLRADESLGQISAQDGGESGVGPQFDVKQQRNYLAFFNNVHYLGSIVTNDKFDDAEHTFHDATGALGSQSYKNVKQDFISTYTASAKDAAAVNAFKKRNVATARNAIGINNGYCLRIQNQEYKGEGAARKFETYYGPIVGVCEVKLLTLVQGEGGGYVYADNIHADENNFLNTSGNFVFPGIVPTEGDGAQYIVDDCFLKHYGTTDNITSKNGALDEAHYWYVEGNKYFFNTTLTGFTYQEALDFNLIENDPNIILSGMEKGSKLNIKKIEWLSNHRRDYECVLENSTPDKIDDYEFDIQIGGIGTDDWKCDMPRYNSGSDVSYLTTGKTIQNDNLPQFNILLQDKLDNSGESNYINHLDEPELVKIYLEGEDNNGQKYEYTVTLNIVYLQGPTFEGGVDIENCALPGELIAFSSNGIKIKTPELMPVTASSWQILPLKEIDDNGVWHWDNNNGIVIPKDRYNENLDGNIEGTIPALYKQNEYTIAYIFTAGGKNFPVMPKQTNPKKEQRMIVVHNYHRMKDVVPQDLQIEKMETAPNHDVNTYHPDLAQAKLYIEDEEDLRAFIEYLNMAIEGNDKNIPVGLENLDIILQSDITLSEALPDISQSFAGNFHGDGYHIDLDGKQTSLFGNNLEGKVYNLGILGGSNDASAIANTTSSGTVINSYVKEMVDANALKYGRQAYELSHYFTPTHEGEVEVADADNYVKNYYANGDYQYATANRVWSLRQAAPNYGKANTKHDVTHTHDVNRWSDADGVVDVDVLAEAGTNVPLNDGNKVIADSFAYNEIGEVDATYHGVSEAYANDYLFFGQHLDKVNADAYPMHINAIANGDAEATKGGNRVFKAAGYYQSKEDQQFFYNKDAWALYPELTAIDFTTAIESDGASTVPTMFSVDSNNDGGTYSNETTGRITQNLLVYNSGEPVFDKKDVADINESDVVYHNIVNCATDYFHLVDKQDFNAPIAFNVNTRAWYERKPQTYRNVGDDYNSSTAWEGICLPFTATKVTAEKNGEISHFYGETEGGDHTLHHEYWLTGFTALAGDKATFARPSVSGTGLFVNDNQNAAKFDYTYGVNSYFTSLFNYNNHYDTRDDEGDDTMDSHDNAWYAMSHTFKDYVPLTAAVPYIVAFPGDDFYEFTMESYYKDDEYGREEYPQMATFESGATTIKVTDDDNATTTVGTHNHKGTYLHVSAQYGINDGGTAFEYGKEILPFRTYLPTETLPAKPQRVMIYDGMNADSEDDLSLSVGDKLKIYTQGNTIIVESNYDTTLKLYTVSGIYVKALQINAGVNKFNNIPSGLYIIGDKKVKI